MYLIPDNNIILLQIHWWRGFALSHSKKADFICQEIFAKLAMYNFCQMITQPVAIFKKKEKIYSCKVFVCNSSEAKSVHLLSKPCL